MDCNGSFFLFEENIHGLANEKKMLKLIFTFSKTNRSNRDYYLVFLIYYSRNESR